MVNFKNLINDKISSAQRSVELEWFDEIAMPAMNLSVVDPIIHRFTDLSETELEDSCKILESLIPLIGHFSNDKKEQIFFLQDILMISCRLVKVATLNAFDLDADGTVEFVNLLGVNQSTFGLFKDKLSKEFDRFKVKDTTGTEKEIVCFKFGAENEERRAFATYLDSENSLDFLLSLINAFHSALIKDRYLICAPSIVDAAKLKSFFYYSFVFTGGSLVEPRGAILPSYISLGRLVPIYRADLDYKQFYETLGILEDSNAEENIIARYLKLYQVIENFMYRSLLTELVNRTTPGHRFTIRKFKSLYTEVNTNELDALRRFFEKFLKDNHFGTARARSTFVDKFSSQVNTIDRVKLEKICTFLGREFAQNSNNLLEKSRTESGIPKIIYFLRNSIVHNKETEMHISNSSIKHECIELLELLTVVTDFLSYCIQYILSAKIELVQYNRDNLILYENNERL